MGCGVSLETRSRSQSRHLKRQNTKGIRGQHLVSWKRQSVVTSGRDAAHRINDVLKDMEFVEQALKTHNKYRSLHGSPPLVLSLKLTKHAQNWANTMAKKDLLLRSNRVLNNGEAVGENIYMGWTTNISAIILAQDAVCSWYEGVKHFNFDDPGFSAMSGSFCQIVWRSTQYMGIARAHSNEGHVYVAAFYSPPGNAYGAFTENVQPAQVSPNIRIDSVGDKSGTLLINDTKQDDVSSDDGSYSDW